MKSGAIAARAALIQIRDEGMSGVAAASLLCAAMAAQGVALPDFMLVIGTYLAGALDGVPVDPEYL